MTFEGDGGPGLFVISPNGPELLVAFGKAASAHSR